MIKLNNGYFIDIVTLDGEYAYKLECPNCCEAGFIDEDQFKGNVSIDCPECEFHETVNLRDEYLKTKGYDPEELGKQGIKLLRELTNKA